MTDLRLWNAPGTAAVGSCQARTDLVVASPNAVWWLHKCRPFISLIEVAVCKRTSLQIIVLGLSPERIKQSREVRKDVDSKLQTK